MPKRPDPVREAVRFVESRLGKGCFAPLTGQDWRAFRAWVPLVDLYLCSDQAGQGAAIDAMRAVLRAPQEHLLAVFRAAIPSVGDWCHEDQIWAEVWP